MSDTSPEEIRVFFSWQSDSPAKTNSGAIRSALKVTSEAIEKKYTGVTIVLDEATRNTSGSPNIADKIVEKIDAAQIYIADITTVTEPGSMRPCANPNVLIELGYAVAQVGWDRTILLFNDAIANFPGDLPFDIIQNRVSNYSMAPEMQGAPKSAATSALQKLLEVAIQAVIEKNPKTPIQLRGMARERIQHERDVENLNWLLSQIHIPTLDEHIDGLPRYIRDRIFWFWESFKGVVTNSLFHIYDPVLEDAILKLFEGWRATLAFSSRYRQTPGGDHVFSNPGDSPLNSKQEADWQQISEGASKMSEALQALLDRVRNAYVEVDIKQTNAKAWKEYHDFHKEFDEKF